MSLFSNAATQQGSSVRTSSLFGNTASSTSNLFGGNTNANANSGSSLFGNTSNLNSSTTPSLFGKPATAASSAPASTGSATTSLFGNPTPAAGNSTIPNLFVTPAGGNPASLLGSTPAATQATSGGLFANAASSQTAPTGGLFGANTNKPTTSLFGSNNNAPAPSSGLFGASADQAGGSLFGNTGTSQNTSAFGQTGNAANTGSLFGNNTNQNTQNQLDQSSMLPGVPDLGQSMMDSRRIWNEEDGAPRSRTVMEQLQLVNKKWDPSNSQHAFQTYLYNQVHPDAQPFYRPGPGESEEAWEEALRKAPNPGAIPFQVRGFYQLGLRIISQQKHLEVLVGRLHEINNGLTTLMRKHELEIASRTAAARRRHAALRQRVLTLATKTMIAKNRGYQLEPAEEELRKKLVTLERGVMDPSLFGREEEIWARMVSVREKCKLLEEELQRAGLNGDAGDQQEISEDVLKQVKKILEDYDSQLSHMTKELGQIRRDWDDWEKSKSGLSG